MIIYGNLTTVLEINENSVLRALMVRKGHGHLERLGIYNLNFQVWKVMEFKCEPWEIMEK